jgi:hypothetical protein
VVSPCWGNEGYIYHKIDNQGQDNVIWPDAADVGSNTRVFYDNDPLRDKSNYDHYNNFGSESTDFFLAIHNPTGQDYTSWDSVWLTVYDSDGNIIDSDAVLNQSPDPPLYWVAGFKSFRVEVDAGETVLIKQSHMFDGTADHRTMKIHSPTDEGPGYGYFTAAYRCVYPYHYRTNIWGDTSGYFSTQTCYFAYGYTAPAQNDLDGLSTPCCVLPYWKDTRSDGEWTTGVHIVNVEDFTCDITVNVRELDGTLIKSYEFDGDDGDGTDEAVPAHGLLIFHPSQFLDSGDEEEGYLEVTSVKSSDGQTPAKIVGMANLIKFSVAEDTDGLQYSVHSLDFFVEDNG